MEEMMIKTRTMMMIRSSTEKSSQNNHIPTWKLYENPYYTSPSIPQLTLQELELQEKEDEKDKQEEETTRIHQLHLPISTRKIAASFWDLTFIKPFMESELDEARAQIVELKVQLDHERKSRKKMESANKKLVEQVAEERKGREALEKVCEELAKELSTDKTVTSQLKRDIEEERKMLRVAEVLREERVQMKLGEAKLLLEEKLLELEAITNANTIQPPPPKNDQENQFQLKRRPVLGENSSNNNGVISIPIQKRGSPEAENPHIKRGIKGFVEFPRVVRAIGSKSRHFSTKLECQKAQLMILLKHKSPPPSRSNNLIMS